MMMELRRAALKETPRLMEEVVMPMGALMLMEPRRVALMETPKLLEPRRATLMEASAAGGPGAGARG